MQTNSFWCFLYPFVIWKLCAFQISFVRALYGGSSLESSNMASPRLRYMSTVTLSVSLTITARHILAIPLSMSSRPETIWFGFLDVPGASDTSDAKCLHQNAATWLKSIKYLQVLCVNLPNSCRKLWSAKSSSRRSKLHSASCLPLRERMKTKVSARVSTPFSFRALG